MHTNTCRPFKKIKLAHSDNVTSIDDTVALDQSMFAAAATLDENHLDRYAYQKIQLYDAIALKRIRETSEFDLKELFSKLCMEAKEIPYDVMIRTHELCARYLGGAWNTIEPQQIRIKAITGGMSNLLFMVELPENATVHATEPTVALLRIHCNVDMYRLMNESIVFTMLSERSLGPKLLGVFPGGRFEQYIPSRALLCHELSYPGISKRLGVLLARIHMLNVPIAKDPMIIEVAEGWLKKLENLNRKIAHKMRVKMISTDLNECPKIVTYEVLAKELQVLNRCLEKSNSPVVFCHNDLQEGNVLLHNKYYIDQNGELDVKDDEPLVLIDFEYANYNYRGFDFGNHVCEFVLDYGNKQPPYYFIRKERAPTDEQLSDLFSAYLDEMQRQNGNKNDSMVIGMYKLPSERKCAIAELIAEARRFTAVSHLFWCIWSFLLAEESPIEFDYISYGLDRLALYYEDKHHLLEYLKQ